MYKSYINTKKSPQIDCPGFAKRIIPYITTVQYIKYHGHL